MTAMSKDLGRVSQDAERRNLGLAAAATVYEGSAVCLDSTGYGAPAADTTLFKFAGVAEQGGVGSATAGAIKVPVTRRGIFRFLAGSTFAAKYRGCPVCFSDDQTVKLPWEVTNHVWAGKLVDYDATYAWVEIDAAVAGDIGVKVAVGSILKLAASLDHAVWLYKCPVGKKARVLSIKRVQETISNFDTTVLNVSNRDASAGADDLLTSAADVDLEADTANLVTACTLTATVADLELDENDAIKAVVTTGANLVAAGEGVAVIVELVEW